MDVSLWILLTKLRLAQGKQNLTATCPKGMLEFKFLSSTASDTACGKGHTSMHFAPEISCPYSFVLLYFFSVCYLITWPLRWAGSGIQMFLPQAQPLTFVRPLGQLEWNPGQWVVGATLFRYVYERKTWEGLNTLCSALLCTSLLSCLALLPYSLLPLPCRPLQSLFLPPYPLPSRPVLFGPFTSLTVPSLRVPFLAVLSLSVPSLTIPFYPFKSFSVSSHLFEMFYSWIWILVILFPRGCTFQLIFTFCCLDPRYVQLYFPSLDSGR